LQLFNYLQYIYNIHNSHLDISQLITHLSLEFIRHFCDLFEPHHNLTPNNVVQFINRFTREDDVTFLHTMFSKMNVERVKQFFFSDKGGYENSLCNLIAKSLCLLIESVSSIVM